MNVYPLSLSEIQQLDAVTRETDYSGPSWRGFWYQGSNSYGIKESDLNDPDYSVIKTKFDTFPARSSVNVDTSTEKNVQDLKKANG